jgi:hypothetical protein
MMSGALKESRAIGGKPRQNPVALHRRADVRQSLCVTVVLLAIVAVPRFEENARLAKAAAFLPGSRVLLDAHNCYPYHGQWTDRIDRALKTGLPLAIEQDLVWYTDQSTGRSWSIVAHNEPFSGGEPTLKNYLFERIRPLIETALQAGDSQDWPLITLNLDLKTEQPEHLAAIWDLLGEYESWLCTAERRSDIGQPAPLELKPLLVLTGSSDAQQKAFHDDVPVGKQLRLFGAAKLRGEPTTAIEERIPLADNYRRWLNNPWLVVEEGKEGKPVNWTSSVAERLLRLVNIAHTKGLWIRFYTLNGHRPGNSQGWNETYNFGSEEAVRIRWEAAIEAGVDFVATDQYEAFVAVKRERVSERSGK